MRLPYSTIRWIAACAIAAAAPNARAAPDDAGVDTLTLPRGRVALDVFLEANLSTGQAFAPFAIAPDVWFGATDRLTLGLVHSKAGRTGFIDGDRDSLCLTGTANGCPRPYNNVGVDLRYALSRGTFGWALDGGAYFQNFSPVQFAIKLGAIGRFRVERFALEFEPAFFVGLTNRTETVIVMGMPVMQTTNGDFFSLPVTGMFWITTRFALALQIGARIPIEDTSANYAISLSPGFHVLAADKLDFTAAFSFTRLNGSATTNGVDGRALVIGGSYAF